MKALPTVVGEKQVPPTCSLLDGNDWVHFLMGESPAIMAVAVKGIMVTRRKEVVFKGLSSNPSTLSKSK